MNSRIGNWIFLAAGLILLAAASTCIRRARRVEPGPAFAYSLDPFLVVDESLIHYEETGRIVPPIPNPSAIAIAPDGALLVGGEQGIAVLPEGRILPLPETPGCLAIDEDGTVFAGLGDRILILSPDASVATWPAPRDRARITSIAVDDRHLFAADAGNRRVWRYDRSGGPPFEIGARDPQRGIRGFHVPSPFFDIAIGPDGSVWAVNPGYHALENYRPDGSLISFWERSSFAIEGFSGCCNPAHFALMPDGSFVTSERGIARVKIHNADGSLRSVVAAPDQFDGFTGALDLAVDATGRIHVLDPSVGVIRIFEEKP